MKSDQIFSPIIAGVMRWGVWGAKMTTSGMAAMIDFCCQSGITTFDHADIYGDYTTEQDFGTAFRATGISRDDIRLISKCGIMRPCAQRLEYTIKHYDTSTNHIIASTEQSLKNLKTDYLDMLLIHRPGPLMNYEAIAQAFTKLAESGKVKHFGVSNFLPHQCAAMRQYFPIINNQVELSVARTEALYDGTTEFCLQNDMVLSAWSPLGGNILHSHDHSGIKKELFELASELGCTPAQLALQFVMHHPMGIVPVIGTTRTEGIMEALGAIKVKLSDEQWYNILRLVKGTDVP